MDNFNYWRLCDELSVVQAALLIVGAEPADQAYVMDAGADHRITGHPDEKGGRRVGHHQFVEVEIPFDIVFGRRRKTG